MKKKFRHLFYIASFIANLKGSILRDFSLLHDPSKFIEVTSPFCTPTTPQPFPSSSNSTALEANMDTRYLLRALGFRLSAYILEHLP